MLDLQTLAFIILKKPNMPALCSQDAKLQSFQNALAKANYMIMQSTATLETSQRAKEVSDKIVGNVLDSCIHAVTLSTWAVQQLDQVRPDAFKPVLPGHLLPQADVELAETLTGRPKHRQTWKMQPQRFRAPADKPYPYQACTKTQPTHLKSIGRNHKGDR